jgi:hypothetical protein
MYSFLGIARPQSQFPHSCVYEQFIYSQDRSTHFLAAEQADRSWKYMNLSQIYECRNWETEHYNSVLEITVQLLGIHKWEPDIYIGFSSALHLQCREMVYMERPTETNEEQSGVYVLLCTFESTNAGFSSFLS